MRGAGFCRDEVLKFVKKLHGFGDFAASNVAMHLKFYDIVPMDSETVRLRVHCIFHLSFALWLSSLLCKHYLLEYVRICRIQLV